MSSPKMHEAQVGILYMLRHRPVARFSELMQPTGMQGDVFKFHVRKLAQLGYVVKNPEGMYTLTDRGKEFANDLDEERGGRQHQPKLSVVVFVTRRNDHGDLEFLVQERRRQPYHGYWSVIGGPVLWGEQFEDAGLRELRKQTGLNAKCNVHGFYRKQDFAADSEDMLEDKLFIVLKAEQPQGELSNDWPGGSNAWMTMTEFRSNPKHFSSVCDMAEMLEPGASYASTQTKYAPGEY